MKNYHDIRREYGNEVLDEAHIQQNPLEQFKTRVYLKESLRQISSLEIPIKDAMSTLELTSRRER